MATRREGASGPMLGESLERSHMAQPPVAAEEVHEINDHPIEEVRLTVPIDDDPNTPELTFRLIVLGIIVAGVTSYINQYFAFREARVTISPVVAQLMVTPLAYLMAAYLPARPVKVPFTRWAFNLNSGPFNKKEHALLGMFANSARGSYSVLVITSIKAFYQVEMNAVSACLLVLTTQLMGIGWAGLFIKILVESPYMWWPSTLVQVSLLRAFHERRREKGGVTRLQFFMFVCWCSLSYYVIPGFILPSVSAISFVCLFCKNSVGWQQVGSGLNGLGIGSFTLDWATISGYLGSPLASPLRVTVNAFLGFLFIVYGLTLIFYWVFNAYEARKFPILSAGTFDRYGKPYNVTRVINEHSLDINLQQYESYSKPYVSILLFLVYGCTFASLAAAITHLLIFESETILEAWRNTITDVHTRIMRRNYDQVPGTWFFFLFLVILVLSVWTVQGFNRQWQVPLWGLFLTCAISFLCTLPIGIILATTNVQIGFNVIIQLIVGWIFPGKAGANMIFKAYGYSALIEALSFLQDVKLGYYMKVSTKSVFIVEVIGRLVSSIVYYGTSWDLLENVANICRPQQLPEKSPWTCPGDDVFFNASVIWGVVGPTRLFGNEGIYGTSIVWFLAIGFSAPVGVWLLSRRYPNKQWIRQIHVPILLSSYSVPARPINYIYWGAVGILFKHFVFKKWKSWWARNNYLLSAGLDAGVALTALLIFIFFTYKEQNGPWWASGRGDGCPLAHCPTAAGIIVDGCPVQE